MLFTDPQKLKITVTPTGGGTSYQITVSGSATKGELANQSDKLLQENTVIDGQLQASGQDTYTVEGRILDVQGDVQVETEVVEEFSLTTLSWVIGGTLGLGAVVSLFTADV